MYWIIFVAMLLGCAHEDVSPNDMGYKDSSWHAMTESQRSQAWSRYYRVVSKRSVLRGGALSKGQSLRIGLADGAAHLGPEREPVSFRPLSFEMGAHDVCRQVLLQAQRDASLTTYLTVCMDDKYIYIDPSFQDQQYALGSMFIPVNKLLAQGVAFCDLNTRGVAGLQGSCLSLTLQDNAQVAQTKPIWHLHPARVNDRYLAHLHAESL